MQLTTLTPALKLPLILLLKEKSSECLALPLQPVLVALVALVAMMPMLAMLVLVLVALMAMLVLVAVLVAMLPWSRHKNSLQLVLVLLINAAASLLPTRQ